MSSKLAMQGEFRLLVVVIVIACMDEFKANWRVLTMSGRGPFKCCIVLVVQQDRIN